MGKIQTTYSCLILCSIVSLTIIEANLLTPSENDIGNIVPRIIGGQIANLGEFKGVVSIQSISKQHICGGTLIKASTVLTAAHCVMQNGKLLDPRNITVIGNDLKITAASPSAGRQLRNATKIVIHPNYNSTWNQYDIAIITVAQPFIATKTFSPVQITDAEPAINETCSIAGWGYKDPVTVQLSENLQKTSVNVIPKEICNGNQSYHGNVPNSSFCAGSTQGKICNGDNGAGLICNGVVKGVASFFDCNFGNFPGVYTNVNLYKKWIHTHSGSSITSAFGAFTLIFVFFGVAKLREILF